MQPSAAPSRVVVVDDDAAMRDLLSIHLGRLGHTVSAHGRAADALARADAGLCDVIVSDVRIPGMDGIELCRAVGNRVPVILISAFGTMETAISALRAGAADFMPKPFRMDALAAAIARAVPRAPEPIRSFVGSSEAMMAVRERVARIAPSDAPVLVTGESGTGKELVARAIHAASGRANGPLVVVNCAAIPAALVESELFGHVRGAFTDAKVDRDGLFASANGGTLFLDEIGELPLEVQPKLLRALQERAIRPVGAASEQAVDVRVIAATNRELDAMVAAGTFREDLYYRVHVLHVALPPLRDRGGDVLELARRFARGRAIEPDAASALARHSWPGNVRELESALVHAIALAGGGPITRGCLPERVTGSRSHAAVEVVTGEQAPLVTLAELERRHVEQVLEYVAGNKTAAARILGIERKTLYRMLERWQ